MKLIGELQQHRDKEIAVASSMVLKAVMDSSIHSLLAVEVYEKTLAGMFGLGALLV